MKLLIDQDVYRVTIDFLRSLGHDVVTASDEGLARASDEVILRHARQQGRILVTRDKGFGSLVYLRAEDHRGVVLLRMDPLDIGPVHEEMARLLQEHTEAELSHCFAIVEPGRHRIRKTHRRPPGPSQS